MMKKGSKSGKVPTGWLGCPANGKHLIVSKFMALKTPLSEKFDNKVPTQSRYHPKTLFCLAQKNNVKVGLWIDLTNTDRYYCKDDIENEGCKYLKMPMSGHGETPSKGQTRQFIDVVEDHITKNPFDCIAVHCTHGFNRTGFLITSFLVEKLRFSIANALEIFAHSRPPGIYRGNYIKELFRRYGNIADAIPAPKLPHWVNEKDQYKRKRKHDHKQH